MRWAAPSGAGRRENDHARRPNSVPGRRHRPGRTSHRPRADRPRRPHRGPGRGWDPDGLGPPGSLFPPQEPVRLHVPQRAVPDPRGARRRVHSPIAGMKPQVDLLVAFDEEAINIGRLELVPNGTILFDSSSFTSSLPNAFGFPFATMAGGALGQPIYKNTAAYGEIG